MTKNLPMKLHKLDAKIYQDFLTVGIFSFLSLELTIEINRCMGMAGLERW